MKRKNELLIRSKGRSVAKLNDFKSVINALIIELVIAKNIFCWYVSTCAVISVDKIRKNATFINKVIIYGERGSGEDADVKVHAYIRYGYGLLYRFAV